MRTDKKELYGIVIDFLPRGYVDDRRPHFKHESVLQAVGTVPKTDEINIHDTVYIGEKERDKIERVKRRIGYNDLTKTARLELPFAIETIVKDREEEFVAFFNKAVPITSKQHMLHLLPGIGKKLMWEILETREKKLFESFADISERIKAIPHPEQMILKRIIEEIENPDTKYHIFTSK